MSSHSQKLPVGANKGASALELLPPIAALPPPDAPNKSALALNVADAAARSVAPSRPSGGASFRIGTGREEKEKDPRKSVMFAA